jgi:transcription elongation GreA/GreB family factor
MTGSFQFLHSQALSTPCARADMTSCLDGSDLPGVAVPVSPCPGTFTGYLHDAMSKAFTREDDDAGFQLSSPPPSVKGPVTAIGARLAAKRVRELDARLASDVEPSVRAVLEMDRARAAAIAAAPMAAPASEDSVSLGAEVRFRDATGRERVVVVASADEIGLVPHAASATSPVARSLLGARAGDTIDLDGPEGAGTLLVLEVRFPK